MNPLVRTLETPRLLIRPLQLSDADSLHELVYSDPDVANFFAGGVRDPERVRQTLTPQVWWNANGRDQGFSFWAVLRRADNQLIGRLNYGRPERLYYAVIDPQSPYVPLGTEVGYAFGRPYWGQGYAYEAVHALIHQYIFPELRVPRLIDHVDAANHRSINLLTRLGFHIQPNHHPDEQTSVIGLLPNPQSPISNLQSPSSSFTLSPSNPLPSPNPLLPTSFSTPHLTIRPLTLADFPTLQQTLYNNPAVQQSFGRITPFEQVGNTLYFLQHTSVGVRIREVNISHDGFGSWGVFANADDSLLGQITLGPPERAYWLASPNDPTVPFAVELSHAFTPAAWRSSTPAEACQPLLDYALRHLRLQQLVNYVPADNHRSLDLLTTLGFHLQPNPHPQYPGTIAIRLNDVL